MKRVSQGGSNHFARNMRKRKITDGDFEKSNFFRGGESGVRERQGGLDRRGKIFQATRWELKNLNHFYGKSRFEKKFANIKKLK